MAVTKGKGESSPIGLSGDATKELTCVVTSAACVCGDSPGTDHEIPKIIDAYAYTLEGVMFKDGLLVGGVSIIVSALVPIGTVTCLDTVTIGETIPCGKTSCTGGSKEKSSVVYCGGTKYAPTLVINECDPVDTFDNAKVGSIT